MHFSNRRPAASPFALLPAPVAIEGNSGREGFGDVGKGVGVLGNV
jgi:hypothetical protein